MERILLHFFCRAQWLDPSTEHAPDTLATLVLIAEVAKWSPSAY